jgi:hypothetical protein
MFHTYILGGGNVKKLGVMLVLVALLGVALVPRAVLAQEPSCWGQATAVFAHMGEMGEHASQEPTPRDGLRNLARLLADDDVIPNDSMAALGAFVADALGLSVEACGT